MRLLFSVYQPLRIMQKSAPFAGYLNKTAYLCNIMNKSQTDISPEIAVIEANTLSCMGLKSVIERLMPAATVRIFPTFASLTADTPDAYAHYFVGVQTVLEHNLFFQERRHKTIVLTNGSASASMLHSGFHTLDTSQSEEQLIRQILRLHQSGHGRPVPRNPHNAAYAGPALTRRETEVLALVVRGLLNKEIADRLHISLTTVITHRKNIVEKLGIRSVSGLTIYAVMNGYVEADDI